VIRHEAIEPLMGCRCIHEKFLHCISS